MEQNNQNQITDEGKLVRLKKTGIWLLVLNIVLPVVSIFIVGPGLVFLGVFGAIPLNAIFVPFILTIILNILGIYYGVMLVNRKVQKLGMSLLIISLIILGGVVTIFAPAIFK